MFREISEEVRVNLKDRLRDMRYVIRQHRHAGSSPVSTKRADRESPLPFPAREIESLLGHAASVFDDAMTIAETLAPHKRTGRGKAAKGFAVYFGEGNKQSLLSGERAFRRDMYHMIMTVLAKKNIDSGRVHEAGLAAIHASMCKRHGDLLKAFGRVAGDTEKLAMTAELSSALLIECLNHNPLRLDISTVRPIDLDRSLEVSCLAPVALACGLASLDPGDCPEPDSLDMTVMATEARLERIVVACRGADPLGALTTIFAMLLFHLR